MSVRKIALGVFLGNMATALLSVALIAIWSQRQSSSVLQSKINAEYEMMLERQQGDRH